MKNLFPIILMFCFFANAQSQTTATTKNYYSENKKHKFYFYWGYNRSRFAKSNIRFIGPDHDFTLHKVVAKDRPTPFSIKGYFSLTKISIPQYNYRIGYFLNSKTAISIGLDHMKYVVTNDQTVKISGQIDSKASTKYAGNYNNQDIVLSTDFLKFEHTDGLNLLSADVERLQPLYSFWQKRFRLNAQAGLGVGMVIPRTDAHLFEKGENNPFHIAGWSSNVKAGFKLDILKHLFLQTEYRAGFTNLTDILILHTEPQRAKQNIFFGQWYGLLGWYF